MNPQTTKPPVLPKPDAKRSIGTQFWKFLGLAAAGVTMVAVLVITYAQATRRDTTEDYVFLCEGLFEDLPVDGSPTVKASDAEIKAKIHQVIERSWHIARRGKRLAPMSKSYAETVQQADNAQRNVPGLSPVVFGSAEALLGVYVGQKEVVNEGGQKALNGTEKLVDAFATQMRLMDTRHVVAIQLSELVPQFSGPMTNDASLTCSFTEHTSGIFGIQRQNSLVLVNASGQELHDCVVTVRLSDNSGNSFLNLYFVPDWQNNEKRVAEYSNFDIPKDTVDGVVRVAVDLYAKEYSMPEIVQKKPESGWPVLE